MNFRKSVFCLVLILTPMMTMGFSFLNIQVPTPTQIPIDTGIVATFPSLDCQDIKMPLAGSTWYGITIGASTISDMRNSGSELNPNYSENSVVSLQITEFSVRNSIAKAEDIPALIYACVHPDDAKVIAIYVTPPYPQSHIQELVSDFGVPDLVMWDESPTSRVALWLTKGVAASVSVDETEQFVPYGTITRMVYFPYQTIKGYEERWPYTHRASSKANLVTLTPSLSYLTDPFDFDTMIATITAQPSPTFTLPTENLSFTPTATP